MSVFGILHPNPPFAETPSPFALSHSLSECFLVFVSTLVCPRWWEKISHIPRRSTLMAFQSRRSMSADPKWQEQKRSEKGWIRQSSKSACIVHKIRLWYCQSVNLHTDKNKATWTADFNFFAGAVVVCGCGSVYLFRTRAAVTAIFSSCYLICKLKRHLFGVRFIFATFQHGMRALMPIWCWFPPHTYGFGITQYEEESATDNYSILFPLHLLRRRHVHQTTMPKKIKITVCVKCHRSNSYTIHVEINSQLRNRRE